MSAENRDRREPPRVRAGEATFSRAEGRLTVSVTLTNDENRAIFVVDHVRRIEMDPATRRLVLWFSDRGKHPDPLVRREHSAPRALPLEPGESRTITAQLPEDMTRLVAHEDGAFHLEQLDLSQAIAVELRVAVALTPFYYNPDRGTLVEQLAQWGSDISARAKKARPSPPKRQDPGSAAT